MNKNIMILINKSIDDLSLSINQTRTIIVSIVILAFLLRIYNIDKEGLWGDEIFSVMAARGTITEIVGTVNYGDLHPPFYYIVLHFWMKLFGDSEFSLRFISATFGILSVYVIYRVGKLIFNEKIGLLSAFLLSISYIGIRYAQEARSYSLLLLLILLSNYYFIAIIKDTREKEKRDIKHIVGYFICTILLLYTHYFGIFYVIAQNLYYILIYRKDIRLWITVQFLMLLSFSFLVPIIIGKIGRGVGSTRTKPDTDIIYSTFEYFVGSEIGLYAIIVVCVIYAFIHYNKIMAKAKIRKDTKTQIWEYISKDKIFILIWAFVPILAVFVISDFFFSIYRIKYLIGSLPAFILLISNITFEFKRVIIVLILVMILVFPTTDDLTQYYQVAHNEQWRDAAEYIKDNTKGDDIVLVYSVTTSKWFKYYYEGNIRPIRSIKDIDKSVKIDKNVWFVLSEGSRRNLKNISRLIDKEMLDNYKKEKTVKFRKIEINYYVKKSEK